MLGPPQKGRDDGCGIPVSRQSYLFDSLGKNNLIRKADQRFDAHLQRIKEIAMPTDTKDFLKTLPVARRRAIKQRAAELRDEYMPLQELRRPDQSIGTSVRQKLFLTQCDDRVDSPGSPSRKVAGQQSHHD
jgi:hypothetical protein